MRRAARCRILPPGAPPVAAETWARAATAISTPHESISTRRHIRTTTTNLSSASSPNCRLRRRSNVRQRWLFTRQRRVRPGVRRCFRTTSRLHVPDDGPLLCGAEPAVGEPSAPHPVADGVIRRPPVRSPRSRIDDRPVVAAVAESSSPGAENPSSRCGGNSGKSITHFAGPDPVGRP